MADHGSTVRGIDYKATFPLIHLFRGFRLAIDPTKIALAMAALVLLYLGGRVLDAVWPHDYRAVPGELTAYTDSPEHFRATRNERATIRDHDLHQLLVSLGHGDWKPTLHDVTAALRERRDQTVRSADAAFAASPDPKGKDADDARARVVQSAHARFSAGVVEAQDVAGQGLFMHFLGYEIAQVDRAAYSAVDLDARGVAGAIGDFFITAPMWAFIVHPVFSTLFFLWLLLIASIFGGGITRVAAVQVARDEKISIRQALRFSTGKVLSFIFAPLIPILIILVLGLVLAAATCLISAPWGLGGVWAVIVGLGFFLALLGGLIMMLTAVGLIGGGNLMYPTIAAEGSDSFDAVSRSFSYVYARPWQVAFYSAIAIVYGAITYLFVRLALYALLRMVHSSIDLFQWGRATDGTPIFDAMWPMPPGYNSLTFATNYAALGPVQALGAFLISIWVWLTVALLGAYAISLYFSSSTIIYYLLRKDVDATEMDDVYLEPSDDDFADAPAGEAAADVAAEKPLPETPIAPRAANPAASAQPAVPPSPEPPSPEPQGQPIDLPLPPTNP